MDRQLKSVLREEGVAYSIYSYWLRKSRTVQETHTHGSDYNKVYIPDDTRPVIPVISGHSFDGFDGAKPFHIRQKLVLLCVHFRDSLVKCLYRGSERLNLTRLSLVGPGHRLS